MNVYDFDNTILKGDSTALFISFCVRRHPALLRLIPGLLAQGCAFLAGRMPKQQFKEKMFTALMPRLTNPEAEIEAFWDRNMGRIKPFYSQTRRPDDVIISASPEFLILPVCSRLGIGCAMASPVDVHTGRYCGANCHGEEKVRRFRQRFPEGAIRDFYSDSHSDDPLAAISERAYLVKGNALLPWNEKK